MVRCSTALPETKINTINLDVSARHLVRIIRNLSLLGGVKKSIIYQQTIHEASITHLTIRIFPYNRLWTRIRRRRAHTHSERKRMRDSDIRDRLDVEDATSEEPTTQKYNQLDDLLIRITVLTGNLTKDWDLESRPFERIKAKQFAIT